MARAQGAEVIDFEREDPVAAIRELTSGIGVDRAIDAVARARRAAALAQIGRWAEAGQELRAGLSLAGDNPKARATGPTWPWPSTRRPR